MVLTIRTIRQATSRSLVYRSVLRCYSKDNKEIEPKKDESVSKHNIKPSTSRAAPAPFDASNPVSSLLSKNKKPYIPKIKHERLTYDYPGLPNQDDFTKYSGNSEHKPIKPVTRWSRYVPKILTAIVVIWGAYTVKVWVYLPEKGSDSKELLSPTEFHKFIVTHKEQIDEDHFLVELTPKYNHWQYNYHINYAEKSIWNGDRIWSVEIKQPEIMVVRSYTPLPLYFMKSEYTRSGEKKPLLKVIDNDIEDYDKQGVMTLYVKRYKDGEVSRYITGRNIGDELELRGPHINYKFPYHPLKDHFQRPTFKDLPSKIEAESLREKIESVKNIPKFDNLAFYGAGTGIAPILQVLLSRNPYRGHTTVHYSAQAPGELEPLERFLFFLEQIDRILLKKHYDSDKKSILTVKDVKKPTELHYLSPLRLEQQSFSPEESLKMRMRILEGENEEEETIGEEDADFVRYDNAIEQARATKRKKKEDPALALVCGPEGYIGYVAGPKDLEAREQGPVDGLLGKHGWSSLNVYKL